jgi:hypothetical protein
MGSTAAAAFIGFWTFWILLIYGFAVGELRVKHLTIFLVLWLLGRIGLPSFPWEPAHALFPAYVAALDIALVFTIFKGDVPLW